MLAVSTLSTILFKQDMHRQCDLLAAGQSAEQTSEWQMATLWRKSSTHESFANASGMPASSPLTRHIRSRHRKEVGQYGHLQPWQRSKTNAKLDEKHMRTLSKLPAPDAACATIHLPL